MSIFQGPEFPEHDDPFSPPPEYQKKPEGPKKFAPGSFRIVSVTPLALDLVNEVIDRAADFDRALAEGSKEAGDDCKVNSEPALLAYGDLIQAKGKLIGYLARLMDRVNDPALNQARSTQVRFK